MCRDGNAEEALFNQPSGLAVSHDGSIIVVDFRNHRLRRVSLHGTVTTIAGSGQLGFTDGIGPAASFNHPFGIAIDRRGAIYVSDHANNCIRRVTPADDNRWEVSTLCGSRQGKEGFADGASAVARFRCDPSRYRSLTSDAGAGRGGGGVQGGGRRRVI